MNASHIFSFADKAAITGVGETDFVKGSERTAVDMMLEASRRAIADAGLKPSDIDGMVPPPIYTTSEEMAANLGIDVLRYAATVHMGGASPTTALQNAAMAISSGLCNHVLVTLGWNGYSALRQKPGAPPTRPMNMNTLTNTIQGYYIPYGVFFAGADVCLAGNPPFKTIRRRCGRYGGSRPCLPTSCAVESAGLYLWSPTRRGNLSFGALDIRAFPALRLLPRNRWCLRGRHLANGSG